jgi:hypothetical protein
MVSIPTPYTQENEADKTRAFFLAAGHNEP